MRGGGTPPVVTDQALNTERQREEKIQRLRHHADTQPDHFKTQCKRQVSQAATYKSEIHAFHTELQNMTEKSVKRSLSSRPHCLREREPEVLLNTASPRLFGSLRILPSQMVTPMRPKTGERTP